MSKLDENKDPLSLSKSQHCSVVRCLMALRGPYRQKYKDLYYSLNYDESLYKLVRSKIKWGNRQEIFSIYFIENELFTEVVKKGNRGNEPNGQTVEPTQLLLISIEAGIRTLQHYRESFWIFISLFELNIFLQKNAFLPKKLKFQTVCFFSEFKK